MRREGIDISALRRTSDRATGAGFVLKDAGGNNLIAVDIGANACLDQHDIDRARDIVSNSDVVVAQLEIPLSTALYGLRIAAECGCTSILHPAPGQRLIGLDLTYVDFLTPNETEARVCAGYEPDAPICPEDVGAELLETGCRTVVITVGDRGAIVVTKDATFHVPAFPVTVIDTNGAGDAFTAALAVAVGEGKPLKDAIDFASSAAALSCTRRETIEAYHDRQSVELLLKRMKGDER
jgi:ribokinase